MKNFNINRFGNVVVTTIADNRKIYIQTAAIAMAVIVLAAVVNLLFLEGGSMGHVAMSLNLINVVAYIYLMTSGAFIVSNMDDRAKRIANFMLPATKLEKFVGRIGNLFVLIPVAFIIGVAAGDLLQMAMSAIIVKETNSIIALLPHLGLFGNFPEDAGLRGPVHRAILIIYCNSMFLAAGTLFRKYSWIKSGILICSVLAILFLLVGIGLILYLNLTYGDADIDITLFLDEHFANNTARTITDIILTLLVVLNYWLGYRVYSRMQVAANRWYNL